MVAGPSVVGRNVVQRDVRHVGRPAVRASAITASPPARICTGSNSASVRTSSAHTAGNRLELARPGLAVVRPGKPGGRVRLPLGRHAIAERCGRVGGGSVADVQCATCGGMASVQIAFRQVAVGVDAAVAEERPVRAHDVDLVEVALDQQRLLVVVRCRGPARCRWDRRRTTRPRIRASLRMPVRLTAATNTPLAIAWLRIIVSQAECWLAPYSAFSLG